jgi:hypothetical protein
MATSLRNLAPSTFTRAFSFADAMSMPITSSRSATHSVPPKLRNPFGAFSPVNQSALTTDPSRPSFEMRPLPSRSVGVPLICDTNRYPDPSSR